MNRERRIKMATKYYDLSQLLEHGAAMWPPFANEVQVGESVMMGIRSSDWRDTNHPGWYDMGWPFPWHQGPSLGSWIGHLHAATHVVAPQYCLPEGITADKIPLENLY